MSGVSRHDGGESASEHHRWIRPTHPFVRSSAAVCFILCFTFIPHNISHVYGPAERSHSFYHQGQERNQDQDILSNSPRFAGTPPPVHANMHTVFICQENKLQHKVTLWMKFTHKLSAGEIWPHLLFQQKYTHPL